MENDNELIRHYLEGDNNSFEKLIFRYTKIIYRFVYRTTNNKDDSFDITQEIFLKVWKNIKKYDDKQNFKTWLFTIARNTSIDWLRKKRNYLFSDLTKEDDNDDFGQTIADTEPLQDAIFEQNELADLLKKVLIKLSMDERTILILHNEDYLTFEEISEIFKKPTNTIKSIYRRSLIKLKRYLESAPK